MRFFVVAALLVVGCKKDKAAPAPSAKAPQGPQAPVSTTEQDALWKLAPDGAIVGVVVSSRGISSIESGWLAVRKLIQSAPEFAKAAAEMEEKLTKVFGSSNVSLADVGLAPGKGAAMFAFEDKGELVIVPLANRDKFLQVTKGTKGADSDTIGDHVCKTVQGIYACAKPAALLDRVGKAPMGDKLKLAGARGDIEITGAIVDKDGKNPTINFAATVQLERGGAIARGAVQGVPAMVTDRLKASGKQTIDAAKSPGFAIINLAPMLAGAPIPPQPIAPGVTLDQLVGNIDGPVTVTVAPGTIVPDLRIPMKDTAPAQKLIDQCETLPAAAMFGAKLVNGACHVSVPQMQMELDAWIDGKQLRIGNKAAKAATTIPPSAAATEIAQGEWAIAMYGRGTLFGEGQFPPIPMAGMGDEAKLGFRVMSLLNELGVAVRADGDTLRFVYSMRTAWSNPDDVVAKLMAIDPMAIVQGKAAAAAKEIATAHPSSPFAADFKAGLGGVMIPTATIGMLAAVAIPAFMDYMKKSKKTEAALQLNKLAKNLKVAHITNNAFPKGKTPLTPAKSCCGAAGNKCDDAKAWQNPIWQELDFQIDEPHLFRYGYESNGKTFMVRAVGDLDCDGNEIAYVLTGTVDAQGNVSTTIVEPAPNTD
jgi:type II secretory pathway pseudopilin PulG